ncbi:unnamed protein product [Auanema sp. JU1783]|nr:unnamed protein product [Auanema sp. JU1783]
MARISNTNLREIPKTVDISKSELENQVRVVVGSLQETLPSINFAGIITDGDIDKAHSTLFNNLGFSLCRQSSSVCDGGKGVFVHAGKIAKGQVAAFYPGTIYEPGDSILLQSLGNHFILRCMDGMTVDGNDRRLSKMVHRSANLRDLSPAISDQTWLLDRPLNYLTIGQYVNNAPQVHLHNVQYVDLDIRGWSYVYRKWFPYSVYNASPKHTALRIVLLVAIRDIHEGEELMSAYISR